MMRAEWESWGMAIALHRNEAPQTNPLVLLAPFPFDARIWSGVVEHLDGRAITVDPPGFGASSAESEASLEAYALGVLAALDAVGVRRFVVAGNSMGGYATLALAELAPERISGIGLIGTKSTADTDEARANRLVMADKAEAGEGGLVVGMLEKLLSPRAPQPVVDEVTAVLADAPTAGIAWAQRAMAARPDRTEVLRALSVPAVVIHGADDALMSYADMHRIADALGVEVEVLDAGHLVGAEAPVAVAESLATLL